MLIACPKCSMHVAASERSCPFCGRALRGKDGTIAQTTAAMMLGLSVGGIACADESIPVYGVAAVTGVTSTSATGAGGACADPSPIPPGGPFPSPADAPALCSQPGESVGALDSPGVRAWLPGRWFFCAGEALFDRPHAGLEFLDDSTWYFLDLVGDELVRADEPGSWTADGPACVVVDVHIDRPTASVSSPFHFAVDPIRFRLILHNAPVEYIAVGDGGGIGGAGGAR